MNKTAKTILIIAICMLPIGVIATVLGISFGGRTGWRYEYGTGKGVVTSEAFSGSQKLDEFDSLDVEVRSAEVVIMRGDSFGIEYSTYKGKEPVITQENGKVTVKQPPTGFVMFEFGSHDLNTFTITVPENSSEISLNVRSSSGDVTLDRIKVSGDVVSSSGDIMFNDIEGKEINATSSSGDINGDKVKVAKTRFESSSGDISMLRVYADDLLAVSSSGDTGVYNSAITNVDCEASSGDVDIELNGKADDYSYDLKASSGDIVVNGVEVEKNYKEDGGNNSIIAKTSSGDVNVSIK